MTDNALQPSQDYHSCINLPGDLGLGVFCSVKRLTQY